MAEVAGRHCSTCGTPAGIAARPVQFSVALVNAQRLLVAAETETNLPLMERLEKLADSWIAIAGLLKDLQ